MPTHGHCALISYESQQLRVFSQVMSRQPLQHMLIRFISCCMIAVRRWTMSQYAAVMCSLRRRSSKVSCQ